MMGHSWNRRQFVSTMAGAPVAFTGPRSFAAAPAAAGGATPGASADQGLQMLMEGNKRFVAGNLISLKDLPQRRAALVNGQNPFATILCCSDSRVPPELVFDQTLGQLFVIRTAGQVIDTAARSSIMYAVDTLKTPLLLVLGHAKCGAVSAAVAALKGSAIPGYAFRFAEGIGPAVQSVRNQPGDEIDNAVRANVRLGVDQMKTSQPVLAEAVSAGRLKVAGGYYDLASGEVSIIA